jgi:hypothetical protein
MSATLLQKSLLVKDFSQVHVKNIIAAAKAARDTEGAPVTSTQDLLGVAFNDIPVAKQYLHLNRTATLEAAETALLKIAGGHEQVGKAQEQGTLDNKVMTALRNMFKGGSTYAICQEAEEAMSFLLEEARLLEGGVVATRLSTEADQASARLLLAKTFVMQLIREHQDKLGITRGNAEHKRLLGSGLTMIDFADDLNKKIMAIKIDKKESGQPGEIRATLKPGPPTIVPSGTASKIGEDGQQKTQQPHQVSARMSLPPPERERLAVSSGLSEKMDLTPLPTFPMLEGNSGKTPSPSGSEDPSILSSPRSAQSKREIEPHKAVQAARARLQSEANRVFPKSRADSVKQVTPEGGTKRAANWSPQGGPKSKRGRFDKQQPPSPLAQHMPPAPTPSQAQQQRKQGGGWDPVTQSYSQPCKWCKEPNPRHRNADCAQNPNKKQ